jgi:hypothetical protein
MLQPDSEGVGVSVDPLAGTCDPRTLLGDFTTDLWFPRYRTGVFGSWELRLLPMSGTRGYWGRPFRIEGTLMLFGPGPGGPTSWMALLPSEIEAQEISIRGARGHSAVLGLGTGWVAANVALQREVHRVTVVERDPELVELVRALGIFDQLPADARGKIDVICADALEWHPAGRVDTLHADIWPGLIEDKKLSEVRRMQDNIGATAVHFWGQEAEIWRAACRRTEGAAALDWPMLRRVVAEDIALPLMLSDSDDYPRMIVDAARWWRPDDSDWWRR